jgi:lipoate-protein ligase A
MTAPASLSRWRLLPLGEPADGPWNMAVDEALLESAPDAPTLRFYRWSRPSASVGYFQDVKAAAARFAADGRAVVRRITGGGLVEHGKDLTVSLVLPESNPWVPRKAADSYRAIHEAMLLGLAAAFPGLRFAGSPRGLSARRIDVCFEEPVSCDLVHGGRKAVGSSQRRRGGRLLSQTAVFLDVDPGRLAFLIREGLRHAWGVRFEEGSLSGAEAALARTLATEKYAAPAFSVPERASQPAGAASA